MLKSKLNSSYNAQDNRYSELLHAQKRRWLKLAWPGSIQAGAVKAHTANKEQPHGGCWWELPPRHRCSSPSALSDAVTNLQHSQTELSHRRRPLLREATPQPPEARLWAMPLACLGSGWPDAVRVDFVTDSCSNTHQQLPAAWHLWFQDASLCQTLPCSKVVWFSFENR